MCYWFCCFRCVIDSIAMEWLAVSIVTGHVNNGPTCLVACWGGSRWARPCLLSIHQEGVQVAAQGADLWSERVFCRLKTGTMWWRITTWTSSCLWSILAVVMNLRLMDVSLPVLLNFESDCHSLQATTSLSFIIWGKPKAKGHKARWAEAVAFCHKSSGVCPNCK